MESTASKRKKKYYLNNKDTGFMDFDDRAGFGMWQAYKRQLWTPRLDQ